MNPGRATILIVDDEPNVVASLSRTLKCDHQVMAAGSGSEAIELLESQGPFAVIVADLRMPGIDGVELFARSREIAPDSVRILLTGNADLPAALSAINNGNIYRLLQKPCPPDQLRKAVTDGVKQHELVTAERVLLEETLFGCVNTLSDVLALASPAAFGRTLRLRRIVRQLAPQLGVKSRWELEVPTLLSQIGAITFPFETAERHYEGQSLTPDEEEIVAQGPQAAAQLLVNIPRLEEVARVLKYQAKNFDGSGQPRDSVSGVDIPLGARVIKLVSDYDLLESSGLSKSAALDAIRGRSGWYDPELVELLVAQLGQDPGECSSDMLTISVADLEPGMVFQEDVKTRAGVFLIARGCEATPGLIHRLTNIQRRGGL